MESELNFLHKKVDEAYNKIEPWKNGGPYPFWLYIRKEYDDLRSKYDSLEKILDDHKTTVMYGLEHLKDIEMKLDRNKADMLYLMPAWCIPLEPIISGENCREDFNVYTDYLYKMVQYLGCLAEKAQDSFRDYESTLDAIKRDIKRIVENYRDNYVVFDFWKESMELREMLHQYPSRVEDVTNRYSEQTNTHLNLA